MAETRGFANALEPGAMSGERRAALVAAWRVFWASRAVVWIAGVAALALLGLPMETSQRLDPLWLTLPFEDGGANALLAPAARFDSAWYLEIAAHGYTPTSSAFFPLYPLLISIGGALATPLAFGIAFSCGCAIGALYLLHRLVTLEVGAAAASAAVAIVAWYPSAIVLSAVYTDALFLLLSVGSIYAARLGRWRLAGVLGALGAATRSSGVLLVVPLLALYLYGPRGDRPQGGLQAGWRPRHRIRTDALWIALVPFGLLAFIAYLAIDSGNPTAPVAAQGEWRRVPIPLGGVPLGVWSALTCRSTRSPDSPCARRPPVRPRRWSPACET
jgi:hypothetical protein